MNMPLGHHSLIDFNGCDEARLKDTDSIRNALLDGIREAGGTIVTDTFHTFTPFGVSGVVVIAESHVTIHTWPEHGYAAVDVFSCGVALKHEVICARIHLALRASSSEIRRFDRGGLPRSRPSLPAA